MNSEEKIDEMLMLLSILVKRPTVKNFYTVDELAALVKKSEYTCREWCRLGRIRAQKKQSTRGKYPLWAIPHAEVLRYEQYGLLPIQKPIDAI